MSFDAGTAIRQLVEVVSSYRSCVVAFSGGVDSALVARAAFEALGDACLAVTAIGPSLSATERQSAEEMAGWIGVRHEWLATHEIEQEAYRRNDHQRCFHCKAELYSRLRSLADQRGLVELVNGTNFDDVSDYRPGLVAAREWGVRSPLVECGLGKSQVRRIAAAYGLPIAEKPASPCLASRIAYGEPVTPERLRMVELAEAVLVRCGFEACRVRLHPGGLARIEVPLAQWQRICDQELIQAITASFKQIGFRFVTLDVEGLRSGSLNSLVPLESVRPLSR